jgi:hypothetical protein
MTTADEPNRRTRRVELFATILLSVAALATAWSTYQATRWRGDQAAETGKATAARIESSEASTRAGQLTQVDIATFTQWVDATVAGKPALAEFYERRFRDEFRPAFDAWLATHPLSDPDAPLTPFSMSQYRIADAEQAAALNVTAGAASQAASDANKSADRHMLAVVLFGASLFFAGISTKLESRRLREFLLGLGAVVFLGALVWVATIPVSLTS